MASEAPADSPVDNPWYRQRKSWQYVLVGLAVIVIMAVWYTRDEVYRFDFSRITSARDTELLLDLHYDLNVVEKWRPWNLLQSEEDREDCQNKWATVIAGTIDGFEEVDEPEKWSDLFRSLEPDDAAAAVEPTQVDLYNSLVDFLRINAGDDAFERLKNCLPNDRPALLEREFEKALDNWRQKRYERLVGARRSQTDSRFDVLLRDHGCKLFPASENRSPWRSAVRRIVGRTDYAEMKAWVEEYCTSCQQHLVPVADFRKSLQTTDVLSLDRTKRGAEGSETGRSDELGLLIKLSQDGGVVNRGIDERLETDDKGAELLLRLVTEPTGEDSPPQQSARSLKTGIRLIGLTLTPDKELNSYPRITYEWPPRAFFVDGEVLLGLLRDLGMPRGFRLTKATATRAEDAPPKKNVVHLSCQVVHPHLPGYSHPLEVALGDRPIQETIDELQSDFKSWTKSEEFKEYMKKLSNLWVVVAVKNTQVEGEDQWRCTLTYPFGKVSLDLAISAAGELLIFGQPTHDECRQIVDELLKPADLREFQELAHLLSIDDCQVDPGSGDLRGTLSIHGTLIDSKKDMSGVSWRIPRANGPPTLDFDRKLITELKGLKNRLSQLKTITPATAKTVTGQLKDHLDTTYPCLVGSIAHERLKKSDGTLTNRIVLRLLIGDWPELLLVSREMTADNIKAEVDGLLSEKNIKEQAKKQWKTARTTVSFLGVERQLTGWNPKEGKATVTAKIELPIGKPDRRVEIGQWAEILKIRKAVGGNPKRWDRFIKNQDNTPTRFSELALCRQLDSKREKVERELSDALSKLVQGKVEVKAERNGFGPGRWLQVHPPAIRIAIEVPVPLLPVQVRAGQILCEGRDPYVHFPEEWTVIYLRTFPAGNFSVSDPTIRVNFRKKTLGLGCKLTPLAPLLPGVDAEEQAASHSEAAKKTANNFLKKVGIQTPSFTLRPDNLWLHLAYLEIDLYGGLEDEAFGAKGHLQMLDSYRAAAAELSVAMKDNPSLNAHLETGHFPVPYIAPDISGTLRLDGGGLEMDTAFNLVGMRVNGRMYYRTGTPGEGFASLGINGQIRLPFIGLADAHIQADPAMKQLEITAAAVIVLPVGRFRYRFRAHLDRRSDPPVSGYDLHIESISPTGAPLASFSWVGNSLRELNDEEIADKILSPLQNGKGNSGKQNDKKRKRLSVKESEFLAALPIGTRHKQSEPPLPPNTGKRGGSDLVRNVGKGVYVVERLKLKEDPEHKFRLVDTRRPESESQKFNLPITNYNEVWFWESGTRTIILFHSQEEEKTIRVEFERVKDHLEKIHLGPIKQTQNVFPDDEKREFDPYEDDLSADATNEFVARRNQNGQPSEPERVKSGFLVRWKEDSGTLGASYIFKRKDGGRGVYKFRATEISEEEWSKAGFLDLLRECRQDKSSFVVEADIAKGLAVFVQPEKKIKDCDRISIVSTKMKANPVEVLLTHFKSGSSQRLRAAQLVASRLQKPKPPPPGARVFVGEAGVAIVVDEKQIEFHAFDGDGAWFVIHRTQFTTWKQRGKDEEHPNSRHLPVGFRTKEERERWWRYRQADLLRKLLTSLRELHQERRPEKRWGANPLGLLQALAQSRSR